MKNGVSSDYLFYEEEYGRLKSYFFTRALKKICNATKQYNVIKVFL